jgi:hypothetical protein
MTNMRFIVSAFVFICTFFGLNAQNDAEPASLQGTARVVWSEPYKEPSNSNIQKIIATEGGGFYALRIHQKGLTGQGKTVPILEYYNEKMKLVRSKEIDLNYNGKVRFLKDVVMLKGQLWMLSYFYNEKHEKTYLFAQSINKQNFNLGKDMVKIAEQDETNRERTDVFSLAESRDSSKIVIFNRQPNSKKEQEFSLSVYDFDFKEVWSANAKLPYGRNKFGVEDYQVDNEGNVYLMGIIYTEGANRLEKSGKPTYEYDIVAYRKDGNALEAKEYKVLLKDKFVTDLTFRVADNNDLVCAGFYSEKDAKGIKGSLFFKINPRTQDMTSISLREFDFDFITANLSQRNKERAKAATQRDDKEYEPELFDYDIDRLIIRSDGGVVMIAEQVFVDERMRNNWNNGWNSPYGFNSWNSPLGWNSWGMNSWNNPWGFNNGLNNRNQQDFIFNYNDIIVVNIQPDGEIAWQSRIPKRQMSVNDMGLFSSYAMSVVQDKLYFVYNENPKNLDPNRRPNQTVAETPDRYSVLTLAEVGRNGEVKRVPLFSNQDKGLTTRPKICRQVGRRTMAIYGESGRDYRFGMVGFE